VNAREIREFVDRDRTALEEFKRAYWADVFQRDGWQVVWDAAQALLLHGRSMQPTFPDKREVPILRATPHCARNCSAPPTRSSLARDLVAVLR
jgi:hypothetical protein